MRDTATRVLESGCNFIADASSRDDLVASAHVWHFRVARRKAGGWAERRLQMINAFSRLLPAGTANAARKSRDLIEQLGPLCNLGALALPPSDHAIAVTAERNLRRRPDRSEPRLFHHFARTQLSLEPTSTAVALRAATAGLCDTENSARSA